jgi:hypothetical protein
MNCTKYLLLALILSLFISCSHQPILQKSKSLLLIKSKYFRFNDIVFVRKYKDKITIDALSSGKEIASINITKDNICMNYFCYNYKTFNKKYLGKTYKDNILYFMLLNKPMFHKKHLKRTKYGFTQKISNILYKKNHNSLLFKDKKTKVLIKLKRL